MKKQQRCYIYTRVSTSMQVDGYSLDAQKDKLHELIRRILPKGSIQLLLRRRYA